METITVEAIVNAPMERVWSVWNNPEHITKWAFASDDWEAPYAENDIRQEGRFLIRMAAKDKSASFDFTGTYTHVSVNKMIEYTIDDGRKVSIAFQEDVDGKSVKISETFELETVNTPELQRAGWQAILNNFKKYTESLQ